MGTIYVLPIGKIEKKILLSLSENIDLRFNCNTIILKSIGKPSYAFNHNRNQYYANRILKEILHITPEDALKIIGVTDVDLYIPVLTFVFGMAQLDGKAAIISLYRLRQKYYGLPSNKELLLERAVKEVLHEIGHTFGLTHCSNTKCVMHTSNYIRKVDHKNSNFCSSCSTILKLKSRERGENI